jgi:hypothetical protein
MKVFKRELSFPMNFIRRQNGRKPWQKGKNQIQLPQIEK